MDTENVEQKTSTSLSVDENTTTKGDGKNGGGRKSSIYEQKQIEAPVTTKGNRITARTEHLFKQYERDITVHEAKPLANVNIDSSNNNDVTMEKTSAVMSEKTKVDIAREEKQKELAEMRKQYQKRLEEEERAQAEERIKQRHNEEMRYRRRSSKYCWF